MTDSQGSIEIFNLDATNIDNEHDDDFDDVEPIEMPSTIDTTKREEVRFFVDRCQSLEPSQGDI
jgi:hypothetical protein